MLGIRRPEPSEYDSVRALIETVANETFGDLFAPNPVPLTFEDEDWALAWVAVSDEKTVGVVLTNEEWVSDLWVCREHRRQGTGSKLLAQAEAEIAARRHQTCRLRVVRSNAAAVQFYLSQGWHIAREFAHEKYQHAMLEMTKFGLADVANSLASENSVNDHFGVLELVRRALPSRSGESVPGSDHIYSG